MDNSPELSKCCGQICFDVATALNNLALIYRVQGHYAQAEPLYKRSLAINAKAFGPDHPHVAMTLNNLAGLYKASGQHDLAEIYFRRAKGIEKKALGN